MPALPDDPVKEAAPEEPAAEAEEADDADENDDDGAVENEPDGSTATKKKKKKKKKKKAASSGGADGAAAAAGGAKASGPFVPTSFGSKPCPSRLITGFTDSYVQYGQTEPPTIPVAELPAFRNGNFPVERCAAAHVFKQSEFALASARASHIAFDKEGEIQEHAGDFNSYRIGSEEKRAQERMEADLYPKLNVTCSYVDLAVAMVSARCRMTAPVRLAAEVHREVRRYAQSIIKPGIKLTDMCELLENKNRELVQFCCSMRDNMVEFMPVTSCCQCSCISMIARMPSVQRAFLSTADGCSMRDKCKKKAAELISSVVSDFCCCEATCEQQQSTFLSQSCEV
eukprot:2323-Heterococcus_DN1.PRE.6